MSPANRSNAPHWQDVAILKDDEEGVTIRITKRDTGYHSFSIGKSFVGPAGQNFTHFLSRRHIPTLRRMLDKLEHELDRRADKETPRSASTGTSRAAGAR